MISLHALFWLMVVFFAIIGTLRGWSREIIAMAGLVLSLFALKQFGWTLVRLLGGVARDSAQGDILGAMKQQFYILSLIHIIIAFFSYQGVALIGPRLAGREKLQERLLGMIVGAINGYLIVGALWSFLEFQVTAEGLVQLPENFPYAFDPLITRPLATTPGLQLIMSHLPLPFLGPWLPIMVVVIFLFVIVVII